MMTEAELLEMERKLDEYGVDEERGDEAFCEGDARALIAEVRRLSGIMDGAATELQACADDVAERERGTGYEI